MLRTVSINEEGETTFKKKKNVAVDAIIAAFNKENLHPSYHFIIQTLQNTDLVKEAYNLLAEVHKNGSEEVHKSIMRIRKKMKKLKRKAKNQYDSSKVNPHIDSINILKVNEKLKSNEDLDSQNVLRLT